MTAKTDDLNITQIKPLLSPAVLYDELPLTDAAARVVAESRQAVKAILAGNDSRLLAVVGPCSVHDADAACEYARKLQPVAAELAASLFLVMRIYFEKPRTVIGWKGLINDPDLDESYQINKGLRIARKLLLDVTELGLPSGSEFLDTTFGQFYADLVSWGAIGARTVESQVHRELASGLSMPVGIKNRTDGNIEVAADAILAVRHKHLFPSLTREGVPAIFETRGNESCCLVLRGGTVAGPNYTSDQVTRAVALLQKRGLPTGLMIDCSHANSGKDPARQPLVADDIARQIEAGQHAIRGVMIESHLLAGRQDYDTDRPLTYGQSITDGCLAFDATVPVLERLAQAVESRRTSL
jgi:3-deoxy-7-phosphoheptulonate synthase|tara:strand:+ start:8518 stop:9582 length:1065 start_codon:yes stop_codon:yes gene_type:complete